MLASRKARRHGCCRQVNPYPRAAAGGISDPDRAAVLALDNALRNRQAQPRPACRTVARGVGATERLEHGFALAGRNARAVVVDSDFDNTPVLSHPDACLFAITQRIADDVRQRAGERGPVAGHEKGAAAFATERDLSA